MRTGAEPIIGAHCNGASPDFSSSTRRNTHQDSLDNHWSELTSLVHITQSYSRLILGILLFLFERSRTFLSLIDTLLAGYQNGHLVVEHGVHEGNERHDGQTFASCSVTNRINTITRSELDRLPNARTRIELRILICHIRCSMLPGESG